MGEHRNHVIDWDEDIELYQTSTVSALIAGLYDGTMTVEELLRHGDFGLGAFDRLDGELIILEGVCYHLRSDGSAVIARGLDRTPLAAVTRFRQTTILVVQQKTSLQELTERIDAVTGGENVPLAIRIDGRFSSLRTRATTEQHKPFVPLAEAIEPPTISTIAPTTGTAVGFRTPRFEAELSIPGYHLHYIDHPRTRGGHVMDLVLDSGTVSVSPITDLKLVLPTNPAHLTATYPGPTTAPAH